jgi:nitronate monooxygenase
LSERRRYVAQASTDGCCLLLPPMGFISGPALGAAVSNAGGLGIMSFSTNPPSVLRDEIRHPVVSNEQALRHERPAKRATSAVFGRGDHGGVPLRSAFRSCRPFRRGRRPALPRRRSGGCSSRPRPRRSHASSRSLFPPGNRPRLSRSPCAGVFPARLRDLDCSFAPPGEPRPLTGANQTSYACLPAALSQISMPPHT